jgi:hypothetical protein
VVAYPSAWKAIERYTAEAGLSRECLCASVLILNKHSQAV